MPVGVAVAAHHHFQPFAQRIHHAGAHTVQTARHLIAGIFAAEFAARVQHGIYHRDGRDAKLWLNIHRNAAAVVCHLNDIALFDDYFNMVAKACQRFVHAVVYNFVNKVMKAARAGGANIHARAFAHGLQPFQYLNLAAVVFVLIVLCHAHFSKLFFLTIPRRAPQQAPSQESAAVTAPSADGARRFSFLMWPQKSA